MTPPNAKRQTRAQTRERTADARATAQTRTPRASGGRRAASSPPTPRRGPSSSDILGLLVLGVGISLAACAGGGGTPGPPDGPVGEVTVRFLDVGQGDAVLIRSPEGKTLLVDGGRSQERMRAHLQSLGLTSLDLMVASHADADHIAGLIPAAQLRPRYFINNGLAATTQTWASLVSALNDAGTTFQKANNQTFALGSVKVRIIAPPPGMGDDQNLNSVGVALEFGAFRALMTGDSELKETTAWLAETRPELTGPFQVYKSIHHGASNGDHSAWLAAVRPQNVVISVGDNSYGHPTQAALTLYAQAGAKVYRTDQRGTVTFTATSDGQYRVSTER